jgi:hypothetical protein
MRAILILIAAVMFGLAGGYAWSAMLASPAHGRVPKPHRTAMIDPPEIAADKEWAARGEDQGRPAVEQTGPDPAENPKDVEQSVYYASCADARAAGHADIHAGQSGYRAALDADGDGIACEPYRGR